MRTIKELKEDVRVIFDCRRRVKEARKNGHVVNTRFLSHIASVPEWTIRIFNK